MNCYNGEKYLFDSINSVINQTYKNWELIFWDNRSTDDSKKIFKSYKDKRLKYFLSKDHTQLGEARRRAYEKLKGNYVAILDSDDIWHPTKLEKQIPLFEDDNVGIVICNAHFFNDKKKIQIYRNKPFEGWVFERLLENYYVCLVTLVFRKSLIDKLKNQFDSDFNFIADFDLVLRLSRISKLKYIDEVLAGWRAHGGNDTFKSPHKFVEETNLWIQKQKLKKLLDPVKHKKSLEILINKHNRQLAIFELINGSRINCLKIIANQKNKTFKDIIIFLAALFFMNRRKIKSIYLKRISLGLIN